MPHAVVRWLEKKQFVATDSSKHSIVLSTQDADNATGCRPAEMLLVALGSCVAVDVVEIFNKKRTPLTRLEIRVKGEQDRDPPWAYRHIHLEFRLTGNGLSQAGAEHVIRLAEEKYCSVAATVRGVAQITWDCTVET